MKYGRLAAFVAIVLFAIMSITMPKTQVQAQIATRGGFCPSVADMGVDPHGLANPTTTTALLNSLINNTLYGAGVTPGTQPMQVGGCLSFPPGNYVINGDLTLLCGAVNSPQACITLRGAGSNVTTITENNLSSNIIDACNTASSGSGYVPSMISPAACPAHGSEATKNNQNGVTIDGFTLTYASQANMTISTGNFWTNGVAPKAIALPNTGGLRLIDVNIQNATDCVDVGFGSQTYITRPTGIWGCQGHMIALHGPQGFLLVDGIEFKGGRGTGGSNSNSPLFQGVGVDYTDVCSDFNLKTCHTTNQNFRNNDFEGGAVGVIGITSSTMTLGDILFDGGITDGYTLCAYCFFNTPGETGNSPGNLQHVRISDKWFSSWYSGILLEGGFYTGATGAQPLYVTASNPVAGANPRANGESYFWIAAPVPTSRPTPVGTAAPTGPPLFPPPTIAPGGFAQDGSAVAVVFEPNSAGSTPFACYYEAHAGDNERTMAVGLQQACGTSDISSATPNPTGAPVQMGALSVANPEVGLVPMVLFTPMNGGVATTATEQPYYALATGNVIVQPQPVPSATVCPIPSGLAHDLAVAGFPTPPAACVVSGFDLGAAVAVHDAAEGPQIVSLQLHASKGAAVECYDNYYGVISTCNDLDVISTNFKGNGYGVVFPARNPPTDYFISSNDFTGQGVGSGQFVNQPTPTISASLGTNSSQQISNNRGLNGVSASVAFPGTGTTYYNNSPYFCFTSYNPNGAVISGAPLGLVPPWGSFSLSWSSGGPPTSLTLNCMT